MEKHTRKEKPRLLRLPQALSAWLAAAWQWLAILVLTCASFVLGTIGFMQAYASRGEAISFTDAAYLALQLFTLESGRNVVAPPWPLELARYLAPIVPAWTLLKTLAVLFRERLQYLRLRRWRNHIVVCGLGRKGMQLVREFRAQGERVVGIELDSENRRAGVCRALGALVLEGSATNPEVLRRARVRQARHVVAVCEHDATNVEIAVLVSGIVHERPPRMRRVLCSVHITDPQLCMLFKQHAIFTDMHDPFEAQVVNMYTNAARVIWREYPLDWSVLTPRDTRGVHLVILGFGHTGESAAVQAAAVAHFANGAKLRISVVDQQGEAKRRAFSGRYPHFGDVADVQFIHGDIGDPKILDMVAGWSEDPQALTTVLIAPGSDSHGAVAALDLLARIRPDNPTHILIRMAERQALAMLFRAAGTDSSWRRRVHVVGLIQQVCTCDMLLDKELDVLARAIHGDYGARRRREGHPASDPALVPWDILEQTRKDSNRRQADHIPVKLRTIGCRAVPASGERKDFAFTQDEVELLARMEHARWKAHRHLSGWSHGAEHDPVAKRSPHLCQWEELDESRREMNREPVRNIPALLSLMGQRIERIPPAHTREAQAPDVEATGANASHATIE